MFLKTNLGYLSQIALKNMQLLILITTTANTRCLAQNFRLICSSQEKLQSGNTTTVAVQAKRPDGSLQVCKNSQEIRCFHVFTTCKPYFLPSGWNFEILLAPCGRNEEAAEKDDEEPLLLKKILACSVRREMIITAYFTVSV